MHVYWITGCTITDNAAGWYAGTLSNAAACIKDHLRHRPADRLDVRVELREVETSKSAILRMLNDEGQYQGPPIRTWRVGPRGGLVECENGE